MGMRKLPAVAQEERRRQVIGLRQAGLTYTCAARPLCTRAEHHARHLKLPPRAEHEALKAARASD